MILYVLLLSAFAVATTEFILVGLLPQVSVDLGVSLSTAGLLVSVYMAVVTVGAPAAVLLTRRLPRRRVLAAALVLAIGSAVGSALSGTFGELLASRMGSALAQALFVAVASQVAMAAVPPERQTAAIAKVFNGFALATVIGLPLGTLVGQAYGWHAAFWLVALLSAVGLVGVVVYAPQAPAAPDAEPLRTTVTAIFRPATLIGLLVTLLTFTGFVAAFTYVAPALRQVTGLGSTWVSVALLLYGAGTVVGNVVAGRIQPARILRVLPVPLAALTLVLGMQHIALQSTVSALISVFVLGAAAFTVAPLLQTWLMRRAGPGAAGLAAAVNISVFGLAGALGAGLGGVIISSGLGLGRIGPVASVPLAIAFITALVLAKSIAARGRNTASGVSTVTPIDHSDAVTPVRETAGLSAAHALHHPDSD